MTQLATRPPDPVPPPLLPPLLSSSQIDVETVAVVGGDVAPLTISPPVPIPMGNAPAGSIDGAFAGIMPIPAGDHLAVNVGVSLLRLLPRSSVARFPHSDRKSVV